VASANLPVFSIIHGSIAQMDGYTRTFSGEAARIFPYRLSIKEQVVDKIKAIFINVVC
jgi:hypothetical protein